MHEKDPNYNEVSAEVDMYVEKTFIQRPLPFIQKIINKILLVIRDFWNRMMGKNKLEVIYKPEPIDLKYVVLKDLTDEKLKDMGSSIGLYAIRNRRTGSVVITNGTARSIRAQFNNDDFEIVEAAIKE